MPSFRGDYRLNYLCLESGTGEAKISGRGDKLFLSEAERAWLTAACLFQGGLLGVTDRIGGDHRVQILVVWCRPFLGKLCFQECAKKIMILIFLRCETAVVPFIAQHTGQTKWNLQLVWLTVKAPKAFSCQTTASIGNRDAAERLLVVTALWPAFLHQKMFWWKKNPPNNFHLFYYVSYILSMPSFKPMTVYYLLTLRW